MVNLLGKNEGRQKRRKLLFLLRLISGLEGGQENKKNRRIEKYRLLLCKFSRLEGMQEKVRLLFILRLISKLGEIQESRKLLFLLKSIFQDSGEAGEKKIVVY